MRVLVCPTAFKGSIGAAEAADAMARGVLAARSDARVRRIPLSDGGPGLLDALRAAGADGPLEEVEVSGPLGGAVRGRILWTSERALAGDGDGRPDDGSGAPDVAVLESADACGLHLVPEGGEDALRAHTTGVGELIAAAVARGAAHVVVGLGGSATTDGGTGMARVFGYRFVDASGGKLPTGGGGLVRLARIVPGRPPAVPVTALADVETPLSGSRGAARTFGPQKGATAEELDVLVRGLERLSSRLERDLGAVGVADRPGSGAAGGLGAGLAAFLGAELVEGARRVLEAVDFRSALAAADVVVTGEGAWDATSEEGKITGRILALAREARVPVVLVCGTVEGDPGRGVRAVDGGGRRLDADALADLAGREVEAAVDGEGRG